MNDLNASVGIDFSLLGTSLHAAYEKKGANGYAVLLLPTEQNPNNGVSIGTVIDDIKKLVKGVDKTASTEGMDNDLLDGVSSLAITGDQEKDKDKKKGLDNLIVKLQMAYLYIRKIPDRESQLEYAFQLQVIAKDVIPPEIQSLVDVDNVSISVWNTTRQKILDKMSLVTIDEYIGITEKPKIASKAENASEESDGNNASGESDGDNAESQN